MLIVRCELKLSVRFIVIYRKSNPVEIRGGLSDDTSYIKTTCHNRCGTIKNRPYSKVMGAEHEAKFVKFPSPASHIYIHHLSYCIVLLNCKRSDLSFRCISCVKKDTISSTNTIKNVSFSFQVVESTGYNFGSWEKLSESLGFHVVFHRFPCRKLEFSSRFHIRILKSGTE